MRTKVQEHVLLTVPQAIFGLWLQGVVLEAAQLATMLITLQITAPTSVVQEVTGIVRQVHVIRSVTCLTSEIRL